MDKSMINSIIRNILLLIIPATLFIYATKVENNIVSAFLVCMSVLLAVLSTRFYRWKCLKDRIYFISNVAFEYEVRDLLNPLTSEGREYAMSIFNDYKANMQKLYANESSEPSYLNRKAYLHNSDFLGETLSNYMDDIISKNQYTILQKTETSNEYSLTAYGKAAYSTYLYAAMHCEDVNENTVAYIKDLLHSKVITKDKYGDLYGEELLADINSRINQQ
ncbi:hypothetical protein M2140_001963 [Clostridiales Family XIII bacterium PM5-7]